MSSKVKREWTAKDVADMLSICKPTVMRWSRDLGIGRRIGGLVLFSQAEFSAMRIRRRERLANPLRGRRLGVPQKSRRKSAGKKS